MNPKLLLMVLAFGLAACASDDLPGLAPAESPDHEVGLLVPEPDGTVQPTEPEAADAAWTAISAPACPVPALPTEISTCASSGWAAMVGSQGFTTLAAAAAATPVGGTLIVCPGSWTGPLIVDREMTVRAADPAPRRTSVTALGRLLEVNAQASIVGLTLTGGAASDGGAAVIRGDGSALWCLTVAESSAGYGGGGLRVTGADVAIHHSVFARNHAGYEGGALTAEGTGTLTIADTVFVGNTAQYEGGAINGPSDLLLERVTFLRNQAVNGGGAIQWGTWDPHHLMIIDSTFSGNTADGGGGALDIGTWADDTIHIVGSTFRQNHADGEGGAINFGSWGRFSATVEQTTFSGNSAGEGAAINLGGWLQQGGDLTLFETSFGRNIAQYGGSVVSTGGRPPSLTIDARRTRVWENVGGDAAILLRAVDNMTCAACDFGAGTHPNSPVDVIHGGFVLTPAPATFTL